jgi:enoyl-CoA hydratase/carnithine racemase
MIKLDREGDVHVVRMDAGENRFNAEFVDALNRGLKEVEGSTGPAALVTTGTDKFYSNGLDLEWMGNRGAEEVRQHVDNVHDTFIRMLTFPMITVAALNGHVFAAGAMFALAHDYRVMRADRGFFCLPEVDIKIPFTPQMDVLIRARLPKVVAHEAMCTARRYGGSEAADRQIVDHAVAEDDVLPKAIEIAQGLAGKDRDTIAAIKRRMYADVIAVFEREKRSSSPGGD